MKKREGIKVLIIISFILLTLPLGGALLNVTFDDPSLPRVVITPPQAAPPFSNITFNQSLTDALYIRQDGTSTTSARIPFADGVLMTGSNRIDFRDSSISISSPLATDLQISAFNIFYSAGVANSFRGITDDIFMLFNPVAEGTGITIGEFDWEGGVGEDYFEFHDDVTLLSGENIIILSGNISVNGTITSEQDSFCNATNCFTVEQFLNDSDSIFDNTNIAYLNNTQTFTAENNFSAITNMFGNLVMGFADIDLGGGLLEMGAGAGDDISGNGISIILNTFNVQAVQNMDANGNLTVFDMITSEEDRFCNATDCFPLQEFLNDSTSAFDNTNVAYLNNSGQTFTDRVIFDEGLTVNENITFNSGDIIQSVSAGEVRIQDPRGLANSHYIEFDLDLSNSAIQLNSDAIVLRFGFSPAILDNIQMQYGNGAVSRSGWTVDSNERFFHGVSTATSGAGSGQWMLLENNDQNSVNRRGGNYLNPIFKAWSSDQTQIEDVISLQHNGSFGFLRVGNGGLVIDSSNGVNTTGSSFQIQGVEVCLEDETNCPEAGGNASMIENQSQPSREFNVTYTNNNGAALFVYGSFRAQWHNTIDDVLIELYSDGILRQRVGRDGFGVVGANVIRNQSYPFNMIVLDGNDYSINSTLTGSNSVLALEFWNEAF